MASTRLATYLTCKRGSVGQSEGLLIPSSSVRFHLKTDSSNYNGFELHRPLIKGIKLLLKVIKNNHHQDPRTCPASGPEDWSIT